MTLVAGLEVRRKRRWYRGMLHYRKHPSEPFSGDPRRELLAELEDALNYIEECARQNMLTAWGASELDAKLRECVSILEVDAHRMRALTMPEGD